MATAEERLARRMAANADRIRRRDAKKAATAVRAALKATARSRAITELIARHQDEFDELRAAILQDLVEERAETDARIAARESESERS